jgi:hypothetical protein
MWMYGVCWLLLDRGCMYQQYLHSHWDVQNYVEKTHCFLSKTTCLLLGCCVKMYSQYGERTGVSSSGRRLGYSSTNWRRNCSTCSSMVASLGEVERNDCDGVLRMFSVQCLMRLQPTNNATSDAV